MEHVVKVFDPQAASEPELEALYDLSRTEHLEFWDEDPVPPYEQWKKELLDQPSHRKVLRWVVEGGDGSTLVASSSLVLENTETNLDQAGVDVYVRAEARKQGLARTLLAPALEAAAADGRTMLNGGGLTDREASSFSEHLGADLKILERKSRMPLAGVDRSMLEDWVVKAKERAEGYSLLQWDGPVPDAYLEKFVALTMVMNTAPRDDLEMEDWIHTPERQREGEERGLRKGYRWWTLVARHDESDELVGYTEFLFPPSDPTAAWQEATAVDPTHRDKGLGRWLKAANCLRLLDEHPEIEHVDTWNAFSNAPMLGINIAMGFEVVKSFSAYQIRTEKLRERFSAS